MTQLSRFLGLVACLFYLEHGVPHVHIYSGKPIRSKRFVIIIRIADGHVFNVGLPSWTLSTHEGGASAATARASTLMGIGSTPRGLAPLPFVPPALLAPLPLALSFVSASSFSFSSCSL